MQKDPLFSVDTVSGGKPWSPGQEACGDPTRVRLKPQGRYLCWQRPVSFRIPRALAGWGWTPLAGGVSHSAWPCPVKLKAQHSER